MTNGKARSFRPVQERQISNTGIITPRLEASGYGGIVPTQFAKAQKGPLVGYLPC